jgi:hypothetical protein
MHSMEVNHFDRVRNRGIQPWGGAAFCLVRLRCALVSLIAAVIRILTAAAAGGRFGKLGWLTLAHTALRLPSGAPFKPFTGTRERI